MVPIGYGCLSLMLIPASDGSSSGHQVEDEDDDGENQKDVNPSSQRVAADEPYDPEDE
jgi:hypothetical protein